MSAVHSDIVIRRRSACINWQDMTIEGNSAFETGHYSLAGWYYSIALDIARGDLATALDHSSREALAKAAPAWVICVANLAENKLRQGQFSGAIAELDSGLFVLTDIVSNRKIPSGLRQVCLPHMERAFLELVASGRRAGGQDAELNLALETARHAVAAAFNDFEAIN